MRNFHHDHIYTDLNFKSTPPASASMSEVTVFTVMKACRWHRHHSPIISNATVTVSFLAAINLMPRIAPGLISQTTPKTLSFRETSIQFLKKLDNNYLRKFIRQVKPKLPDQIAILLRQHFPVSRFNKSLHKVRLSNKHSTSAHFQPFQCLLVRYPLLIHINRANVSRHLEVHFVVRIPLESGSNFQPKQLTFSGNWFSSTAGVS